MFQLEVSHQFTYPWVPPSPTISPWIWRSTRGPVKLPLLFLVWHLEYGQICAISTLLHGVNDRQRLSDKDEDIRPSTYGILAVPWVSQGGKKLPTLQQCPGQTAIHRHWKLHCLNHVCRTNDERIRKYGELSSGKQITGRPKRVEKEPKNLSMCTGYWEELVADRLKWIDGLTKQRSRGK
jgi:hypothetical protein